MTWHRSLSKGSEVAREPLVSRSPATRPLVARSQFSARHHRQSDDRLREKADALVHSIGKCLVAMARLFPK